MNLNEYNALRRVTDAVRAADGAFCEGRLQLHSALLVTVYNRI